MSDPTDQTEELTTSHAGSYLEGQAAAPDAIGRYEIQSILGAGGFGTVYLGFDSQLLRQVAVKVPRQRRTNQEDFRSAFLAEARTLAKLDHPHIVPVYDVGSTSDYPCFIVSKYIDGSSLSRRLSKLDWSWEQRADLVASIADALHCAHLADLVHRDVKPGNILLDQADKAHLADFGLALSDEDYSYSWSGNYVGTLMYMSPEQVRGEAHLVDGRADVFSLGVLMYELLTGVRPFSAPTREQVVRNILERDAKPLRQRREGVPSELERICLRALARRTSQRYPTALDFAEDLRAFLAAISAAPTSHLSASVTPVPIDAPHSNDSESQHKSVNSTLQAPQIIPKGLRAFDEEDADFFLRILPDPKDRNGVPESVRFWKRRIETSNPEDTFRVGVVYGPSGCGKSSLVRAGLVPLLANHVLPIVVSATPNDTEQRLRRSIAAACPEKIRETDDLARMLHLIRVDDSDSSEHTVLIVIDQFEQWLSANGDESNSSLIDALRQCDGKRLKCLLLVRNDFWMSVSRVMEELDAQILQGKNSAAVELFDVRHAKRVLFAFGHAYGALPELTDDLTRPQSDFLEQSVAQLAEDGRVICVRLAVYAQMIRDKVWEPRTLAEFGGVSGLGARFLEETFYGRTAPPEYKRFQVPAREILRCLLPTPGSDIRGAMMSEQQLAEVAGKDLTSRDFKQLLRVLNDDLRLLTPTDALGSEVAIESDNSVRQETSRYYQLTHDYLVPSLRNWLSAKQRETARGRAQLCLQDRTALWELNRESRQLPSLQETVRIMMLTPRAAWTESQTRMMDQAKKLRVRQCIEVGLLALALSLIFTLVKSKYDQRSRQVAADALVQQLVTAGLGDTFPVIAAIDACQPICDPRLQSIADDPNSESDHLFRALLALSRAPGDSLPRLLQACGDVTSDAIGLTRRRITGFAPAVAPAIRQRLGTASSARSQLRYAALLGGSGETQLDETIDISGLCEALLSEDPNELDHFAEYLVAFRTELTPILVDIFHDDGRNDAQRTAAAQPLAKYADAELMTELLLSASASQHFVLTPSALGMRDEIVQNIKQELKQSASDPTTEPGNALQVSNGILTLLKLAPDEPAITQHLQQQPDPSARTRVMLECHNYGVPADSLAEALRAATDPVARQALIIASQPYHNPRRQLDRIRQFSEHLCKVARSSPYQSERSAALWVLSRWEIPSPELPPSVYEVPDADSDRDWWITSEGHCMVILTQPIYAAGPQALIVGRDNEASAGEPIGYRRFAISTTEVSREEFRSYQVGAKFIVQGSEGDDCPANGIWSGAAMDYCNWLSSKESFADDELFYLPKDNLDAAKQIHLSDKALNRTSFRLPTEAEWEIACKAGTRTPWSHGNDRNRLADFGWCSINSDGMLHPVGTLIPNPFGLFDMGGNVSEWCHPATIESSPYASRGGSYRTLSSSLRSSNPSYVGSKGFSFTGFRIARTISTTLTREETHVGP